MYVTKNVVLFDRELVIVERVREEMGFSPRSGFSEAVRYIIRDWARMRGYGEDRDRGDRADEATAQEKGR